jgi:predicted  nucleic acid-binding Zn-ribbon protein
MKALLDILNEEKCVVRQINRLDSDIKSRGEYLEHMRRTYPDCSAKERDVEKLIIEIDILKTERSKQEDVLRDVQHELAGYLSYLTELL